MTISQACSSLISCSNNVTVAQFSKVIQNASGYLVIPPRLFEIVFPVSSFLSLSLLTSSFIYSQTEAPPLPPVRLNNEIKKVIAAGICLVGCATIDFISVLANGVLGNSYVGKATSEEVSTLIWTGSIVQSGYCDVSRNLNATEYFIRMVAPIMMDNANEIDNLVSGNVSRAGIYNIVCSAVALLAIGIFLLIRLDAVRKKTFSYFNLTLMFSAFINLTILLVGIYQQNAASRVSFAKDCQNGWNNCL